MNEYIEESCCMLPSFVSIYTALSIFSTCANSLEFQPEQIQVLHTLKMCDVST